MIDGAARPAELQARLQAVYPRCVVRPRLSLAELTDKGTWYVYRDGTALEEETPEWWLKLGAAEATFRDGGVYLTANDEFCAIYGLPPGGAIGRRWDEFATPEAMREADALWRRMVEDGWPASNEAIGSTFTIKRADGALHEIEYRTAPQADGTFRTWHRSVAGRAFGGKVVSREGLEPSTS